MTPVACLPERSVLMRGDFGIVARREVRFADQHRQDRRLRAGLGIVAAAEPFAEAAIGAWAHAQPERIGVGLRQIAGRLRKRLVAELARRLGQQRMAEALLLRRRRIRPRARPSNGLPPSWIWPLRLPAVPDVPQRYSNWS